ncbi:MAG: TRAM domain-containing protein, partial [Tenericutes bacterium]|nr:TRAM domain-containing protein [Mycoplasmatota bacterium]
KYSNESNKRQKDKIVKCLVTGVSDKNKSKVCGYTENMKLVNIEGNKDLIGKIINVRITETKSFSLDGVYIEEV